MTRLILRTLLTAAAFVLALCLTFAITGCAGAGMVKVAEVPVSTITWIRAKPLHCGKPGSFDGCTQYLTPDRRHCRIWMAEDSSDAVVAHEFRHCMGFDHRSPG